MKIVIVGGVAGGATAAARLRRLSEKDEIIIIERDEYISYANCGLPYYIGDVITDKGKLQVQTVKGMSKRFNLDIRVNNEALAIDRKNKTILIKDMISNKEYIESYDKLILSCGATPIIPNIKGMADADNIFSLRNIPDTYKIKNYINNNEIKDVGIIGGGFIGIEMAENLAKLKKNVTIIEKYSQVLRPLDFEMAQIVHQELNNHDVNIVLNDGISCFEDNGKTIVLESGRKVAVDMTIMAIGVRPENMLAKTSGLKLGERGHVVTADKFNVISNDDIIDEDVFAIGDMAEVVDFLDKTKTEVPLAWGANREGRLVADYINGYRSKNNQILASSVLKVCGLTVATTGSNEIKLKQKGIEYTALHVHRANHAGYYPNSSNIAIKILFDKNTGKIYGAQAIGKEGTEKRIDVLQTVIRLNGTIFDLSDLELCYAPPYSSAKDPINILGYIAENFAEEKFKMVYCHQIDKIVADGGYLIDVRTPFEFSNGHIPGAINLELDTLREKVKFIELPKESPIYVNCQVGQRSYLAILILRAYGFQNLYNLSGGYTTYKLYKYKLKDNTNDKEILCLSDDKLYNISKATYEEKVIDVSGTQCPGPLMLICQNIETISVGDRLKIVTNECVISSDIENWCKTQGHKLISKVAKGDKIEIIFEKV